jgi:hypothetical protein
VDSISCPSSTVLASASAWSPSVATTNAIPAVNKMRYVTSTLCQIGMGVVLLPWLGFLGPPLSMDSELFTTLEATDALCLGGLPVRSLVQGRVDEFNKPIVAPAKSLKLRKLLRRNGYRLLAKSSVWPCFVGWTLRSPATTKTGRTLQGPWCNFCFLQGCLCKDDSVMFYLYI